MLLHTFHEPGFDIVKHKVDLKKSQCYHIDNNFKNAYDWLFRQLGTSKVIWCYKQSYKPDPRHGLEHKQWTLDVPDDKIIAGIDINQWNSVIMDHDLVPDKIWCSWSDEWDLLYEQKKVDAKSWKSFEEEKIKAWRKKHGTKEESWAKKIPCKTLHRANEFLIPSPVPKKWVVDVKHFSEYDTNFEDHMHASLFRTFDDAARYCTLVKSFLKGKKLPFKLECERYASDHMQDHAYSVKVIRLWEKDEP